jgi:predicted RNA-binding Zn ribbon-like protein
VDFAHYAAAATDLVNADLGTLESVRRFLATRPGLAERVDPADLAPLQQIQRELGAVVDASAQGQEDQVVALLNDLLTRHVIRPRISGHDASTWHLHVNDSDAPVSTTLIAEGLFGLTLLVTDLGALRLGRCASPICNDAFVDTSPNRSRRFCGSRCATRTNVAALRERRRAAVPADAG